MKTAITWLLLCISLFSNATQASTENPETGMFLLRSDDGSWQPALLLNTDMQVQISGPVAEVQIRQSFSNPGGAFAEGRYVLPTSESAAIHAMTLEIGERRINGQIQEREQARKTYQQARDNGQQTGLVEQQRPNLFST
ncbi:MAG TPA: marine proteobacterial sortase target protein, partial [Pseudomonas sp.]|nr:marine proteobacterial sortase target protein [Pseudomonas sp.]